MQACSRPLVPELGCPHALRRPRHNLVKKPLFLLHSRHRMVSWISPKVELTEKERFFRIPDRVFRFSGRLDGDPYFPKNGPESRIVRERHLESPTRKNSVDDGRRTAIRSEWAFESKWTRESRLWIAAVPATVVAFLPDGRRDSEPIREHPLRPSFAIYSRICETTRRMPCVIADKSVESITKGGIV